MIGSVACVLIVGGQGSFAFWRASATQSPGSFSTGHLSLGAVTCTAWSFTSSGGMPNAGVPAPATWTSQVLQPADVLTRTCSASLDLRGDHLKGTISLSPASPATPATGVTVATVVSVGSATSASGPLSFPSTSCVAGGACPVSVKETLTVGTATTGPVQSASVTAPAFTVTAAQGQP